MKNEILDRIFSTDLDEYNVKAMKEYFDINCLEGWDDITIEQAYEEICRREKR